MRGRVCVRVCVIVFCIHTPSGCCFEMRQYVGRPEASIRPFLLFRADYSAKSYSSEYFLMSFEIQQKKFVSFFVCLNLAGGGKEHICRSDLISALVCEEQVARFVCAGVHMTRDKALLLCPVCVCTVYVRAWST